MSSEDLSKKVPVQNDDMAWRVVDDECIIVDPQGSQATVLNSAGARLWELMDGKRTVADIVAMLVDEFDVDAARAQADAHEFVTDLSKRNLITL